MGLKKIQNGTLADPEEVNDNFEYLEDKIEETAAKIYTNNSSFDSKISTLSNNLTQNTNTLNSKIDTLETNITTNIIGGNGLYINFSFNENTGTWSREFFSDAAKTTRVWLEQGGEYEADATENKTAKDNYEFVLPKTFKNDKFYFNRFVRQGETSKNVPTNTDFNNRYTTYNKKEYKYVSGRESEGKLSVVNLDITTYAQSLGFSWYACGK